MLNLRTIERKTYITKFIAVCDAVQHSRSNRFPGRFVDNLETHFGFVKSFDRRQIRRIKDQRSQVAHMPISSIVGLPASVLFGTEVGTVRDGRLSWYNFAAFVDS